MLKEEHQTTLNSISWISFFIGLFFYIYESILKIVPTTLAPDLMVSFQNNHLHKIFILTNSYLIVFTLLQIPAGLLLDRFGTRQLLTIAALLTCLGLMLFAGTPHINFAIISQWITGIGGSFALIGALFLVAHWLPYNRRAFYSNFILAVSLSGVVLQPTFSNLVNDYGWRSMVLLLGVIGGAFSLIIWLFVRSPNIKSLPIKKHFFTTQLIQICTKSFNWFIAIFCGLMYVPIATLTFLWGNSFLQAYYPYLDSATINTITLMLLTGWLIGNPIIGACSDLWRCRKPFFIIGATGLVFCLLCLTYFTKIPLLFMYILFLLVGIFSSAANLSFTAIMEANPSTAVGSTLGFLTFVTIIINFLFIPLFDSMLHRYWHVIHLAKRVFYSLTALQWAMGIEYLIAAASLVIAVGWLKETCLPSLPSAGKIPPHE